MSHFAKIAIVALAAGALAFAGASTVSAHGEPPFEPPTDGPRGTILREGFGPGRGLLAEYADIMHGAMAQLLGMSPEEVTEARAEGRMLHELAADAGVEMTELHAVMTTVRADMIEAALDDGVLTEEQAQRMLDHGWPMGRGPAQGQPPCDGEGPHMQGHGRWNRGS